MVVSFPYVQGFTLWSRSMIFQLIVFLIGVGVPSSAFQLIAFQVVTITAAKPRRRVLLLSRV